MSRLEYWKGIKPGELTVRRVAAALGRRIREIPHRLAWELSSQGRAARGRLEAYRDVHRGERGWIVANGPSLKHTDLGRLGAEHTIGMNRIYRATEMWNFTPSYLVVTDLDSQLEQIADELRTVEVPQFLNWNGRRWIGDRTDVAFLKLTYRPRFSTDVTQGIWGGHSVTYACLQLAYHMGFEEVILVGKDHSYREQGTPGQVMVASGNEDNHFTKGYYAKGATWRIPDYRGEELGYRMARAAFEADGRRVLDATIGGQLDVFEKVPYDTLI